MNGTMKLDGFAELDAALDELSKAAGKGVLRRSAITAAKPMVNLMSNLAPKKDGDLAVSVAVSTRLDKRQAGLHRKMFRDDRASVEVFVGPSYDLGDGGRHGHLQEFGTQHHAAQPFARPAWDQDHQAMLDRLGRQLWAELDKSIARARRKAARG